MHYYSKFHYCVLLEFVWAAAVFQMRSFAIQIWKGISALLTKICITTKFCQLVYLLLLPVWNWTFFFVLMSSSNVLLINFAFKRSLVFWYDTQ